MCGPHEDWSADRDSLDLCCVCPAEFGRGVAQPSFSRALSTHDHVLELRAKHQALRHAASRAPDASGVWVFGITKFDGADGTSLRAWLAVGADPTSPITLMPMQARRSLRGGAISSSGEVGASLRLAVRSSDDPTLIGVSFSIHGLLTGLVGGVEQVLGRIEPLCMKIVAK